MGGQVQGAISALQNRAMKAEKVKSIFAKAVLRREHMESTCGKFSASEIFVAVMRARYTGSIEFGAPYDHDHDAPLRHGRRRKVRSCG